MGRSVAVMMSSYNGAEFIQEQIESILDQSGVTVSLHVRDDGSTDETWNILAAYERAGTLSAIRGSHVGIGNSFMQLVWSLPDTYDYYAYSDQDDIWMQDKLAVAVDMLERENATLYASSLACMDVNMQPLGVRYKTYEPRIGPLAYIVDSGCYGCTQVFNRSLFETLCCRRPAQESLNRFLHDTWTCVSASIVGTIVFDCTPHIGYRRHDANYTNFDKSSATIWKKRLRKLMNPGLRRMRSALAQEVLSCYADCLDSCEIERLEPLARAHALKNKIKLAQNRSAYMVREESTAWYLTKMFAGLV